MMILLGSLLFFLMGVTLGLVGAGGAILTIPLLIYIIQMPVVLATTYSLFIVGTTASFGVLLRFKQIAFKETIILAIPSITGVFVARALAIPVFPMQIGPFSRDSFLIALLVVVMLLAAFFMIKKQALEKLTTKLDFISVLKIIFYGFGLGFIMGLLGAGGGFLIIPILVLLIGMDMKKALGSSLFIIMLNSFVGFVSDHHDLQWTQYKELFFYSSLSLLGMFLGTYLSFTLSVRYLKEGFGWFIGGLAVFIAVKELFFLH